MFGLFHKCVIYTLVMFFCCASFLCHANLVKIDESLQLYYQQSGKGQQPIVFIPGWTMSSQIFKHQLTHFKESKQYKVFAIDPRGQGLSSKPDTGYTYQQRGKDLAAFIDKLGLNNVILVGWSFGTLDMLSYIAQFGTDNIKAVVVLDGSPKTMAQGPNDTWAWIDKMDTGLVRQSTTLGVLTNEQLFHEQFAKWMLEAPLPSQVSEIVNIAKQTPPFVAALTNETASYADYEQTLAELNNKIPLYIYVRDEWSEAAGSWVKKNAPNAKFTHMGRHLMFWQHSAKFNQQLAQFLNTLE